MDSPDPCHGQLVILRYDNVAALVELLCDVPDAVGQMEVLESLILDVPQLEAVQRGGTAPPLSSFTEKNQDLLQCKAHLVDTSNIKTFSLFSSNVRLLTQAPSSKLTDRVLIVHPS